MKTIIIEKLKEIEKANNIKILFACESGSRAWGFPSPDSDYDVRFVYVRNIEDYLSVREYKDQLSFPITDVMDVYGWDLKKVLMLMNKSNTTIFEWLQSPQIYFEEEGFREALWKVSQNFFSKRSNTLHYLGIAKSASATIETGNEIKIKKLFYILRPLLAAKWCLEKGTIAPMTIENLMKTITEVSVFERIMFLIKQKETAVEDFKVVIEEPLQVFINKEFEKASEAVKAFGKDVFQTEQLDTFFKEIIECYDNKRDKRDKRERTATV
ncbi:nucleotidyltransferase domain-containing protein [Flavobacterium sp. UBA4197]|uniref:nucleotidyltransferase domain-containing protein n=1 Tax=Flavobacterium sp. UBA4197 TaxID=1946546 RepID=UPI00257A4C32|nr:nucleotidyltransferase domain-containing protein [Flavobacterium sp. UBA4197]